MSDTTFSISRPFIKRTYFFVLFFILPFTLMKANPPPADSIVIHSLYNNAITYFQQTNYSQSEYLIDSLLTHYETSLFRDRHLTGETYVMKYALQKINQPDENSREVWVTAIQKLNSMVPPHQSAMARLYITYGSSFNRSLQMDSIKAYLDPAEKLLVDVPENSFALSQLYYQKGRLAYSYSDYASQINYLKKGLAHQEKYFPNNHMMRISLCNGIGIGYRNMGDLESAAEYLNKGLSTPSPGPSEQSMHAVIRNNLGLVYDNKGEYDKCISCVSEAINYYRLYISEADTEIGSGYDNLANCYLKSGDTIQGEYFLRKSQQFMNTYLTPNHRDQILPKLSLGRLKMHQGGLDSAELYFERARNVLVANGWRRDDPAGNFILEDPFDVFSEQIGLYKRRYGITLDTGQLSLALSVMEDFMTTTDYAFQQYNTTASIENYFERYESTYSDALECLFLLNVRFPNPKYATRALLWIEKFKAMEMQYAFRQAKANFSDAHQALNSRHKSLQDSIRHFEHLVYESNEDVDSFSSLLTQARYQLQRWKDEIRISHPAYYELIYQHEMPAIHVADLLEEDQEFLLYKMGNNCLYALIGGSGKILFEKIINTTGLPTLIQHWRTSMRAFGQASQYDDALSKRYLFENNEWSRKLYQLLIQPIEDKLVDDLLIIPDGELGYLSFGALLTSQVGEDQNIKSYPFFINTRSVHYAHSLSMYREMKDKRVFPNKNILAVAPEYTLMKDNAFRPLTYNVHEAKSIQSIMGGTILAGKEASKKNFISSCSPYKFIHLAAHGQASFESENRSFLAYSTDTVEGSNLYSGDIYNLPLQAEMVCLSACQTGVGLLKRNEGVISLARAFSFAGAKCVLSSLWNVNDESTSLMMENFYQELKTGKSKNKALQAATIGYIQSSTQIEAHPYYWSGFIPVGDPSAVINSKINYSSFIASCLLLILLILLFNKFGKIRVPI